MKQTNKRVNLMRQSAPIERERSQHGYAPPVSLASGDRLWFIHCGQPRRKPG